MSVAIVTDSNSGITQKQAEELGIFVLPMPFFVDGTEHFEDIDLDQEGFYKLLENDAQIATSQPAPKDVTRMWDRALREYDSVVHIPMSSGLSGSCATAAALAADYDGRVQVVNNQRISVTQRQSVLDAIELCNAGKNASQIRVILEKVKLESSIYIMVDTLKYLKKGGRITPAVAAIGTLLRLRPVLQIQGERLDTFAKARTVEQAKTIMINAMRNDIENRFGGMEQGDFWLSAAYTKDESAAAAFVKELEQAFPGHVIHCDPLSLSVSCHIGPGSIAVACSRKLPKE